MKNLLIIDLESTCYEQGNEPNSFFSEIIEIGAVVLNTETFEVIEEFQTFVKPVLFPALSDFCLNLTTITQEQVDNAPSFKEAIQAIKSVYERYDCVFASWGFYDKNQFKKVCDKFRVAYPFGKDHISLKHEHGNFVNKHPMGMERALKDYKIPLDGTHHRGIDDARNIAKIATEMIQRGWSHPNSK